MTNLPFDAAIADLDGTLLRNDKTVSETTLRVLRRWREAGGRLFAATARPERALRGFCGEIRFDAISTLNGARTLTPGGVFEEAISPESAGAVLAGWHDAGDIVISAETETGLYANRDIPEWKPTVAGDIRLLPGRVKIYKLLASSPHFPVERLANGLPEDTYATVADGKLLQVMSVKATKWNGVKTMLAAFGIDPARAVYFGDDNDDAEPISKCGCGAAMGNALERVKNAADRVIGSNEEDGVARFLSEIAPGLGEG